MNTTVPLRPAQLARTRSSLPLERKLPLTILGLLLLILTVSVAVSYFEIRREAQKAAGDRLASLSHVVASLVEPQITSKLAMMRRAVADSAIRNVLRHPADGPTLSALRVLAPLSGPADRLTPAELLGRDGQPLGSVHLETPADIEHFRNEIESLGSAADSGYVGKFYTTGGHTAYWLAVPVREDGAIIGYVAQERRFSPNPRSSQQLLELMGSGIQLYFRHADDDAWVDLSGTGIAPPTSRKPTLDSLEVLTFAGRRPTLASTSSIKGTPLYVTVFTPMDTVVLGAAVTIRMLAAIAIVLAVLGAMVAWAISRQLTRPLVELTSAAEAIAEGQYSQRVNARTGDEIGRLGNAFNRMAAQVEYSSSQSEEAVVRLTHSVGTQRFLADASRILAMSLSDETLLSDLARYCVPTIADYCSIQVVDIDGTIRRLETAHHDPAREPAVRALVARYEYRVDGPGPVPDVIRSQTPLLVPRLDHTTVRATAPDDETRRLIDEVNPCAFMCVPLMARGRAVGAMSFTMTDARRTFTEDDLDLAMELGRRTAVAIDNALIYRSSLSLRLEAEAASSAKSDFLAKMSHEIRTPINAMLGYAELLEMGISGPITEAQSKHLNRIRASGEHLTSLVNEILDLAKVESGRMGVEPAVGVTTDAVDAALGLIRPQALAKGVNIINDVANAAPTEYYGDPQRVQQILTNLLSNAVKFTPAGGSVTVRMGSGTRRADPVIDPASLWTWIVVEDTGIGIAPEDRERIFQPFVQVENGYTRNHGGTGLGLTISRTLAHMMSGELVIESEVGKGSCFTLWLPSPDSCIVAA